MLAPGIGPYRLKPSATPAAVPRLCAGSAFGIALLAEARLACFTRGFWLGQLGGASRCLPPPPGLAASSAVEFFCSRPAHGPSMGGTPASSWSGLRPRFAGGSLFWHKFFAASLHWMRYARLTSAGPRPYWPNGRPGALGRFLLESAALMLVLQASGDVSPPPFAALLALLATAGSLVFRLGMPTAFRCCLAAHHSMSLPTALAFVLLARERSAWRCAALPTLGRMERLIRRAGWLIRAFLPNHGLFLHFG